MSLFDVFEGVDLPLGLSHKLCAHSTPQEVLDCEDGQIAQLRLFLDLITVANSDEIMARYKSLSETDRLRIEHTGIELPIRYLNYEGEVEKVEVLKNNKPN